MGPSSGKLISKQFPQELGVSIECYVRGYYCEAREKADELLDHLEDPVTWEKSIAKAWATFLTDWDVERTYKELDNACRLVDGSADLLDQCRTLYVHLFKGWIGSFERMSATYLREAESSLSLASRTWERLNRQRKEEFQGHLQIFNHTFFHLLQYRPWAIYWLRGSIRNTLGKSSESLEDFRSAAYLLTLAACEAHGIPVSETPEITAKAHTALRELVIDYGKKVLSPSSEPVKLVGRFYNDLGLFLFQRGDFRMAVEALQRATQIDEQNPYYLSNLGFVLIGYNKEDEAINPLVKAYALAEKTKADWLTRSRGRTRNEYYASGRIYYHLGLFVYKWLKDALSIPSDRREKVRQTLLENGDDAKALFDASRNAYIDLFSTACQYYVRIKDVTRALPAMVLWHDPLRDVDKPDGPFRTNRILLWELSYGMGDFMAELTQHLHLMQSYLAPELTSQPGGHSGTKR